ncbi:hypothetical protein J41TS12_36890 [Paenibacillus antibioticophila]|uniref:Uncharacterized protein n=1 Tax=Paenibacillus antibioticophila TaxID=1274374 RepID=A0A919XWC0_9BACL|nr:hypothetical protein [Paenibacillus antibioticophila]GIO38828.1 hypothetical protein J41TS12_36890 [Paenibacillus antibioticophila]
MNTRIISKMIRITSCVVCITLLGSTITYTGSVLAASEMATSEKISENNNYVNEENLIYNLNDANVLLYESFLSGKSISSSYEEVTESLVAIDAKVTSNGGVSSLNSLTEGLITTIVLLNREIKIDSDAAAKRKDCISALKQLQNHLGISDVSKAVLSTNKKAGSINVRYGKHSYDSRSQKEYDALMKIVDETLALYNTDLFGREYPEQYLRYLEGERFEDQPEDSEDFTGFYRADKSLKELITAGIPKEKVIRAVVTSHIARMLIRSVKNNQDKSYGNAYDVIVYGRNSYKSEALAKSAVFDAMGYNTAVIAYSDKGYADVIVQMGGKWWVIGDSSFEVDLLESLTSGGHILAQPTNGPGIYVYQAKDSQGKRIYKIKYE